MQPTRQTLAMPITISGITVRTTNAAEFNPLTGEIPGLWGRFMGEGVYSAVPHKLADSPVYGVYSCYESDTQARLM